MTMASTHVLTINHVFEILIHFDSSGSWQSALEKVLPMRKEAKLKSASASITDVIDDADVDSEEDELSLDNLDDEELVGSGSGHENERHESGNESAYDQINK